MKRIKYMEISSESLIDYYKKKEIKLKVINPIPEDSRIVGIEYNAKRDTYYIAIESSTFDEICEDGAVPKIDNVIFQMI
jgi:hypothetical protein